MFRYLDISSYFHKVEFTFRSLRNRNFRMFFCGQAVSLIGTYMQNLALGWLVFRLSGSALLLGVVGFAGQIPSLFLTPFAGVFADRLNRRKVFIATQSLSMCMSFALAALYLSGHIAVWHIVAISVVNGISLAFDTPFRHAFLFEMVGERELLQNAIALNSTLINSARFIGPTVGGVLVALLGEGWCFLINGFSFMAVIGSLLIMHVQPMNANHQRKPIVRELVEGLQYAYRQPAIRHLLMLVVGIGFLGMPFQNFMPVFAKDVLGGDSQTLGILTGALGVGSLIAAFYLASRSSVKQVPNIVLVTSLIFGVGLTLFSLSSVLPLSLGLIFFTGLGMTAQFAATNTLLQHIVDDDMRGRIVSLYGMSFMGITPLGSLLLGAITPHAGVQLTFTVVGVLCLITTLLFWRKLSIVRQAVEGME